MGTAAVVEAWQQPPAIRQAALLHSIYGTGVYSPACLQSTTDRHVVQRLVGDEAERLVYLYCNLDRRRFFQSIRANSTAGDLQLRLRTRNDSERVTPHETFALLVLYMANEAEQVRASDGAPGPWLTSFARMSLSLLPEFGTIPNVLTHGEPVIGAADEALVIRTYAAALDGLRSNAATATRLFTSLSEAVPLLAEPHLWLAYVSLGAGNLNAARAHATTAERLLTEWGTAWDKRLTVPQWNALIRIVLETQPAPGPALPLPFAIGASAEATFAAMRRTADEFSKTQSLGRRRFSRYIESFVSSSAGLGNTYPELTSIPWLPADRFSITYALEASFDSILEEIGAVDSLSFHEESERSISRSGSWDVFMLYERGRKQPDNCALVPHTMRIIDSFRTVKTHAGLAYFSKMQPNTHIGPHRGPTNMRVRCHLPLIVPEGDCGIRVGTEMQRWQPGRCLVFDDSLVHEAWNHTDGTRLVLIVDLWHPDLTVEEIRMLNGFQIRIIAQADNLHRYWADNDRARRERDETWK